MNERELSSPALVFDVIATARPSRLADRLASAFEVLGLPGERLERLLDPGDLVLRRGLGEGSICRADAVGPSGGASRVGERLGLDELALRPRGRTWALESSRHALDREAPTEQQTTPLLTRCGFFGPNVQRSEREVREAVAEAAREEWTIWHTAAGAPRLESDVTLFGHLVRYYLAAIPTVRPDTLTAMQATAVGGTVNYGLLPAAGAPAATIAAEATRVRGLLLAGAPGATAPADLPTRVAAALRHAREAHRNVGPWRAWSAVWVTTCVRGAGIGLGLEAVVAGRHVGQDELLRATAAHREYALEAFRRRFGPNPRGGTYHAFPPRAQAPHAGDIIVQDRQARTQGALFTFSDMADLAHGRQTHGDIVVEVAANHVVTIGGNVGDGVRARRFPLDHTDRLVVEPAQLYAQETSTGELPALPATTTTPLHARSTARIFALLSPVELCAAIPGQRYRGGADLTRDAMALPQAAGACSDRGRHHLEESGCGWVSNKIRTIQVTGSASPSRSQSSRTSRIAKVRASSAAVP